MEMLMESPQYVRTDTLMVKPDNPVLFAEGNNIVNGCPVIRKGPGSQILQPKPKDVSVVPVVRPPRGLCKS